MKKTSFQIIVPILLLLSFSLGFYILYPSASQLVISLTGGQVAMNVYTVLNLALIALYFVAHLFLIIAAIQIFRTGSWKILKVMLYLSIPTFNIFNYISYSYSFGPLIMIFIPIVINPFSLEFNFNVHTFIAQYYFSLSSTYEGIFQVGINVAPIIWLALLKLWSKKSAPAQA